MNKIIYLSSALPLEKYDEYIPENEMTDVQSQKFNRLLLNGFYQNKRDITAISYRNCSNVKIKNEIYSKYYEHHLFVYKRNIFSSIELFISTYRILKRESQNNKDIVIVCDILNSIVSFAGILFGKIHKKQVVGIVTDLPNCLSSKRFNFNRILRNYIIANSDRYVFLTKYMNESLNTKNKPFTIIEGVVDSSVVKTYSEVNKEKVILYAGTLDRKYGIDKLIDAFIEINDLKWSLHIYGDGDYKSNIIEKTKNVNNIKYFGVKNNKEIVKKEKEAMLLVNPRPNIGKYTKYSFPSKIMEYMSSSTAILMFPLDGIPNEYYDYVYLFEDFEIDSMKKVLKSLMNKPVTELLEKGKIAKDFVFSKVESNQTEKILNNLKIK